MKSRNKVIDAFAIQYWVSPSCFTGSMSPGAEPKGDTMWEKKACCLLRTAIFFFKKKNFHHAFGLCYITPSLGRGDTFTLFGSCCMHLWYMMKKISIDREKQTKHYGNVHTYIGKSDSNKNKTRWWHDIIYFIVKSKRKKLQDRGCTSFVDNSMQIPKPT